MWWKTSGTWYMCNWYKFMSNKMSIYRLFCKGMLCANYVWWLNRLSKKNNSNMDKVMAMKYCITHPFYLPSPITVSPTDFPGLQEYQNQLTVNWPSQHLN
jgi:hypothetical protein